MSDVSALMDKLKSTVSYKQFDAPRGAEQAWPVIEKMARAQTALARPDYRPLAPANQEEVAPVVLAVAPAVAAARVADVLVTETPSEGSLFDRLQGDAAPAKSASFSRYGAAKPVEDSPQALSDIFERIGRKAS